MLDNIHDKWGRGGFIFPFLTISSFSSLDAPIDSPPFLFSTHQVNEPFSAPVFSFPSHPPTPQSFWQPLPGKTVAQLCSTGHQAGPWCIVENPQRFTEGTSFSLCPLPYIIPPSLLLTTTLLSLFFASFCFSSAPISSVPLWRKVSYELSPSGTGQGTN